MRSIGREFRADFALVDDVADADFVLNMFDAADPKAFGALSSRGTYSAAFYELPEAPEDVLRASYPMLVRTLSNVVLLHVPVRASGSRRWSRAPTTSATTRPRSTGALRRSPPRGS